MDVECTMYILAKSLVKSAVYPRGVKYEGYSQDSKMCFRVHQLLNFNFNKVCESVREVSCILGIKLCIKLEFKMASFIEVVDLNHGNY